MNLASIVSSHPAEALALVQGRSRINYGKLRADAERARAGLASNGVGPGDRVALICASSPEFVIAYLAVLGVGAVVVPVNPQSPLDELTQELSSVRPAAIVVGPAEEVAGRQLAEPGRAALGTAELIASAGPDTGIVERQAGDPAALLFTSGTAGLPKAAVLTHGSMLANLQQIETSAGAAPTSSDVALLVIPPFHIFGLNAVLGVQLLVGGATVLADRFDPESTLAVVQSEQVTLLPGVPELFAALAGHPGARGDELATVRLAVSGAAPLGPEVAARFEDRFKIRLWQGYGLTEASPAVTFPDTTGPHDPLSVGMPLPGVEVRIIDPDGDPVLPGDPGEILLRGPNVFAGYFEDPAATASVLDVAGWLHTGDIAVMGGGGELTIVDRHKDLIIVSGFNVFPAEVEQVLMKHPDVAEVAVVGVPDRGHGESVRAYVVPRPELWSEGSRAPEGLSEPELVQYCGRYLARYKLPAGVSFVRELPRSLYGKALRRELH